MFSKLARTKSTEFEVSKGPPPNTEKLANTVFSQNWALVVFDEAQDLRSEGHLLKGAHYLRMKAGSMIMCSATPLHNSEKVRAFHSVNDRKMHLTCTYIL